MENAHGKYKLSLLVLALLLFTLWNQDTSTKGIDNVLASWQNNQTVTRLRKQQSPNGHGGSAIAITTQHTTMSPPRNGRWMSLVVLCDRGPNDSGPLMALVKSLLASASRPIKFHYVSQHPYAWLESLHRPLLFEVERHDPAPILAPRATKLMNDTRFQTTHYSGKFAMQKLFLPLLNYTERPDTVLMIDDDIVFYDDVAKLWDVVATTQFESSTQSLPSFAFYCPEDPKRVEFYFTAPKMPRNGDARRYCNSGLIGFNVHNDKTKALSVEMLENATGAIMQDYPRFVSTVADQDVVNRVLADYPEHVRNIPCEWNCDYNSCGKDEHISTEGFYCSNCHTGSLTECQAFHFLAKTWQRKKFWPRGNESMSWGFYSGLNSTVLLNEYKRRLGR